MSTSDWIAVVSISATLFITIIGSTAMLSFKIGSVHEKVASLEKRVTWLEATMLDVLRTLSEMQVKLDILWRNNFSQSKSPITLNETGQHILETSDIKSFINERYPEIISRIKHFKPDNAYQAQELLISVVSQYKKTETCKATLQEIAFSSGNDVDSLLFVAALSIRDQVVEELGFKKDQKDHTSQ